MVTPIYKRKDPANQPDEDVRCDALLKDSYGRQTSNQCWCLASVKLGKHKLCMKHAAMHALQLLLDEGEASYLPRAPVVRGVVQFVKRKK